MEESERLFYLGAGPLAAILLGMALVPVREFTTASNFTFVFLVLTIAVAEFGGRWPAVATALCSALSLDFFLTQPYLRLAIEGKNDIIAFIGLTASGLLVAALAAQRADRNASLRSAREQLDLLHFALGQWGRGIPLEPRLMEVLRDCRAAFSITGAVIRDKHNHVLAASEPKRAAMEVPAQVLDADTLLPPGAAGPGRIREGIAFPKEGVRLSLAVGSRQVGWLDVWGSGAPASSQSLEGLFAVAGLLALMLAGDSAVASRD